MKATGIVRGLDNLGRIVIPKEIRDIYNIKEKDSLEIFINKDSVLLRKYKPSLDTCSICSNMTNLKNYRGKNICENCINELKDSLI